MRPVCAAHSAVCATRDTRWGGAGQGQSSWVRGQQEGRCCRRGVSLPGTLDVLRSVAAGKGPERATLLLGYTGWAPGQLESEIANNDWLTCPAIEDMVFDRDLDSKYERALYSMGVRPSSLSTNIGHA